MLSTTSIVQAQFFFKEYRPIPTEDQNDGRCIINIGGTLNYPNQYLSVGSYADFSEQKSKAHAKRLYWGGFLNDTRNYERPDDEDLNFERIVKEQINVKAIINPPNITYTRGYPAVGTRTIKQGFPYVIANQDTWVSILDRDNDTVLFEDFISGTNGEFCVGKGIVADATDPYNAFYVLMQVTATNGRRYFAIARYYWSGTTINRGWRKIYTHAGDNAYDIDIAGITQEDNTGHLVVAGTYRHRAGTLPSRIFMAKINKNTGGYMTSAAINASQYVSWGTGGSNYPLMKGIQVNSITANDFDDGYTLAGKVMQDLSNWNLPDQYTLPMIFKADYQFNNYNPNNPRRPGYGFSYKVFPTSTDVMNDNFLHGEFYYAKQNHHWRLGSPSGYADTSFTAVGRSYYPSTSLEQYATIANCNLFDAYPTYYQGRGLNRWFTMHNTDFSQSYSTPLKSSAQWYDQDDSYIGAFVYTGRQSQPSGATRAIAAGVQKWDGLSNCSESPYQVDTIEMTIDTNQIFNPDCTPSDWGFAFIEETEETVPVLNTYYCSEGYIIEDGDYPKTAEEILRGQGEILVSTPTVQYSSSQILLSLDVKVSSPAEILISDIMGRAIMQERFDIDKGMHHYSFNTDNLLGGNYFLSIHIGNQRYSYPLSIIK